MTFRYVVTAILLNQELATEYASWIQGGHMQDVVNLGGATSAEMVVLDSSDGRVHVQSSYLFPSRAAYDAYQVGAAVALRAEGKLLWVDTGKVVEWIRQTGEVYFSYGGVAAVTGDGDVPLQKMEWPELVGTENNKLFLSFFFNQNAISVLHRYECQHSNEYYWA